jgi:hypothetical protein
MKKSTSKFQLALLKLLTNFENLPVSHFKDPKAMILTLKLPTGSRH